MGAAGEGEPQFPAKYPRQIKDVFTRTDELLEMLIKEIVLLRGDINNLGKGIGRFAVGVGVSTTVTAKQTLSEFLLPSPVNVFDLLSFIDSEYMFAVDLSVAHNDVALGIKSVLSQRTPFVTEFTVDSIVGPVIPTMKVNDTGHPAISYNTGEGRDKMFITELFVTNAAGVPGNQIAILVGWNSYLTKKLTPTP